MKLPELAAATMAWTVQAPDRPALIDGKAVLSRGDMLRYGRGAA